METFTRIINRIYPELKAGYHRPILGKVERFSQPDFSDNEVSTVDQPFYAVDVQPLDENFKPRGKLLRDMVVMLQYGGQQRGFFALPDPGCIIEFCFAYASPKLIMIRGVIPWGMKLPPWQPGAAHWHSNANVWQGYDLKNNWHRHTTADIQESCDQIRECKANAKQLLKSPKTWIGSESENVLQIMIDMMSTLEKALATIAAHTHSGGKVGAPDQSGSISATSTEIESIRSGRLSPITE